MQSALGTSSALLKEEEVYQPHLHVVAPARDHAPHLCLSLPLGGPCTALTASLKCFQEFLVTERCAGLETDEAHAHIHTHRRFSHDRQYASKERRGVDLEAHVHGSWAGALALHAPQQRGQWPQVGQQHRRPRLSIEQHALLGVVVQEQT